MDITEDLQEFKELCEKVFNSYTPVVDKNEARAGVLGYHPLALLVIALDYIEKLEMEKPEEIPNKLTQKTLKKSEKGEDLHEVDNTDELMEELES